MILYSAFFIGVLLSGARRYSVGFGVSGQNGARAAASLWLLRRVLQRIHRQGRHRRIHAKRDRLLDETECSISCHHVLPNSCVTLFEMHRIEK